MGSHIINTPISGMFGSMKLRKMVIICKIKPINGSLVSNEDIMLSSFTDFAQYEVFIQ